VIYKDETVSCKIQVSLYGMFRHLPNTPWYAFAEYVDNAVQSYLDNKEQLKKINKGYVLEVRLEIDKNEDSIFIEDNAAGIGVNNYWRAFEPANLPIDQSQLNEYGMGMKTASVWLSDKWTVVTTALGEDIERTTVFDLNKVLEEKKEDLTVKRKAVKKEKHGTRIILQNLSHNSPKPQQHGKIKKHLTSIYRKFIKSGELKLYFNGELLSYQPPKVLKTPFVDDPNGKKILWKKPIKFKMGNFSAKGYIALLETMSTNIDNGLSLFRRGRVIVGSHDQKYRPTILCGQPGSPLDKRLFGELELEGFGVSFNKGSFEETTEVEALMQGLKHDLSINGKSLLKQGQHYTKPKSKADIKKSVKKVLKSLKEQKNKTKAPINIPKKEERKKESNSVSKVVIDESDYDYVNIGPNKYGYKVKFVDSLNNPLYTCTKANEDEYDIEVNFAHELFKKDDVNEVIVALVKALALAEQESPNQGTKEPGNLRLIFNELIGRV
tara:strand:- start:4423 stop:5904 length:1482 start_codon:yes stop_codon:yes gene_type:complete